jgi:hypothetical protein
MVAEVVHEYCNPRVHQIKAGIRSMKTALNNARKDNARRKTSQESSMICSRHHLPSGNQKTGPSAIPCVRESNKYQGAADPPYAS